MSNKQYLNIKSSYKLHVYTKIEQISNWYGMDINIHELRAMTKFSLKLIVQIVQKAKMKTNMSRKWVINNISI